MIRRLAVQLALAALLVGLSLVNPAPFSDFALRFNDLNYHWGDRSPAEQVVLVAVDERSVNRFGRWPWNRAELAELLTHFSEAELLVLDMLFSEPTEPAADQALANTIAALDNTICGFYLRSEATEDISPLAFELLLDSSLDRVDLSGGHLMAARYADANILPILSACMMNASFSTLADRDELYRQYPLAQIYRGQVFPSLGVQATRLLLQQDLYLSDRQGQLTAHLGDTRLPVDQQGFIRLNFYPKERYRVMSLAAIAAGEIKPADFAGKIVVLGVTEAGVSDIRSTPLGQLPGPLFHYTFISNTLQNDHLKVNAWLDAAAVVLVLLLPLTVSGLRQSWLRLSLAISGCVLLYLLGKWLYVSQHLWIDSFYPLLALFLGAGSQELVSLFTKDKEAKFLARAFRNYLSPELLREVTQHPERLTLGGETREITVMFCDLRGFTTKSEQLKPQQVSELLCAFLTPMTRIIQAEGGLVDKFIGDEVMALFNAPVDLDQHTVRACRAALAMVAALPQINQRLNAMDLPSIDIGIGLNYGPAIVGNMGSQDRFDYTAVGDTVNLAARIQGTNKEFGTRILITEYAAAAIAGDTGFGLNDRGLIQVRGRQQGVRVYELYDPAKPDLSLADADAQS